MYNPPCHHCITISYTPICSVCFTCLAILGWQAEMLGGKTVLIHLFILVMRIKSTISPKVSWVDRLTECFIVSVVFVGMNLRRRHGVRGMRRAFLLPEAGHRGPVGRRGTGIGVGVGRGPRVRSITNHRLGASLSVKNTATRPRGTRISPRMVIVLLGDTSIIIRQDTHQDIVMRRWKRTTMMDPATNYWTGNERQVQQSRYHQISLLS